MYYVDVLQDPPNTYLENNYANDKGRSQNIQSYYIEPSNGWGMCSKNQMARYPTIVEESISHCFCRLDVGHKCFFTFD